MASSIVHARWFRKGRLAEPRLIVVHCTVSPEQGTGAEAVAKYFSTVTRPASTHLVADSNSVVRCVADGDTAYGAGGANTDGLHIELVGMPQQSKAEWLDSYGRQMFATCAPDIRDWMHRYAIPARWLTVAQIRDKKSKGFTTHADVEAAFPSTGHWDPGPGFPRDEFLAAVTGAPTPAPPAPSEDDVIGLDQLDDRKGTVDLVCFTLLGNVLPDEDRDKWVMVLARQGYEALVNGIAGTPEARARRTAMKTVGIPGR